MTENTPVPGRPGDEPLDEATQQALASMLSDTAPVDPQTRRRHLDAAMAEFDIITARNTAGNTASEAQVFDLAKKREARQFRVKLVGAAAAVFLVVGVGVKFATGDLSLGGSDSMSSEALSETSADSSTADAGGVAEVETDNSGTDSSSEAPVGSTKVPEPSISSNDSETRGSTDDGVVEDDDGPETTLGTQTSPETPASEFESILVSESEQAAAYVNERIAEWFELRNGHLRP